MSACYLLRFECARFFNDSSLPIMERCGLTDARAIELALEHWETLQHSSSTAYDLILDDIIDQAEIKNENEHRQIDIAFIEDAGDVLVGLISAIHSYFWIQLDPLPSLWAQNAVENCEWAFIRVVKILPSADTVILRVTFQN